MDSIPDAGRLPPATQSRVRAYTPSDRAAALDLVGDPRAIDGADHRVRMAGNGAGLAIWLKPTAGEIAQLGPVLTKTPDRRLFYELVRACALDALSQGFERATFDVRDSRLLTRIRRDFRVAATVVGRNGDTQEPTVWRVEVDLADALTQLQAALSG